jgi:DNA-binding SARP family transcriptional activator
MAGQLWPDVPQHRASADLRTALWRLQKVEPGLVDVAGDQVSLHHTVGVDVRELEEWIAATIAPPTMSGADLGPVPRGAGRVLLPGWDEEWLVQARERLRLLQLLAFESAASRLLAEDRPREALPYALSVVQSAPMRESANHLMIEIHLRQGNVADSLHHFEQYRTLMRNELGVEPGTGITSMMAQFL